MAMAALVADHRNFRAFIFGESFEGCARGTRGNRRVTETWPNADSRETASKHVVVAVMVASVTSPKCFKNRAVK